MKDVAVHGSNIVEVIKPGHVTYTRQVYRDTDTCIDWNEEAKKCNEYEKAWMNAGSFSTGAKITGTVLAPSSKLQVQGKNVAKVGDKTNETWIAFPPIPSNTTDTRYVSVQPARSGSGQGEIIGGSSKGNLGPTSRVALIGSLVKTCLEGTTTTIADGNTKMNFSS
ncbi:hypothetical protein [Paenibacillus paeoniae]|uniref:Uncharacterized protein n=1 Tax=Paenibacillus paeoniae TaxID=2292705 RepID=A0A371PKV4_9BACL|nr:hypothetical protein [Paenibacillus paeoniae]REK76299.1 hypothetical protein DX130_04435 [Paenibacillus paeoniae]